MENELVPIQGQAIIWTSPYLLSIGIKLSKIWIIFAMMFIWGNAFENVVCKMVTILIQAAPLKFGNG